LEWLAILDIDHRPAAYGRPRRSYDRYPHPSEQASQPEEQPAIIR
jgi:hypothetical protein